ncbi:MAG: type IV toxin-antitoxin system AbiEi family antitoxin [Deltaproteobacteria bacterium]|nr:type IV toxin-antitoxin system AbiEi family antitoxin [Deltaproteobacteria bacterium]
MKTEERIFRHALEAFKKNVAEKVEIKVIDTQNFRTPDVRPDYLIQIITTHKQMDYIAEVKPTITKAHKLLLLMDKINRQLPHPLLLITRHVNADMAEQLRKDGVEFIDAAGNAYINRPPLYIFVKGNKPLEIEMPKHTPLKRAFNPTGLKVIYAFLCNKGLENKPYREIAAKTGIALGTITWIMYELRATGFLIDMEGRGKRLVHKDTLLKRWVTAYPERLKPKQMLGRFTGEPDWWRKKRMNLYNAQWGGEVAAAKLTHYLEPQIVTIYTEADQINKLIIDNRLRKDARGNVEIFMRFWTHNEAAKHENTVHPILIYADLVATGNERNIETARIIYDEHVVQCIGED